MTDYSDLVERLRDLSCSGAEAMPEFERLNQFVRAGNEAANTIKYLAAEEEHLWTKIVKMTEVINLMDARIDELEAALKPFAGIEITYLSADKSYSEFDTDVIDHEHIYAARKVLGEKE